MIKELIKYNNNVCESVYQAHTMNHLTKDDIEYCNPDFNCKDRYYVYNDKLGLMSFNTLKEFKSIINFK